MLKVINPLHLTVQNLKLEKVKLNGQEALDFCSRKEEGAGDDEGRQERQRIVIEATSKSLK